MPLHGGLHTGFLSPADVEVAQRAFDRLCGLYDLPQACDEAAELASIVIASFQRGVTDENALVEQVSNRMGPRTAAA